MAPDTSTRHGGDGELTRRSASSSTGLWALKFSPVFDRGTNDIASRAEEIAYMCVVFSDATTSPDESVVTSVALIMIGAPAIGVWAITSLNVTATDGGVGVMVGVIVGVLVIVKVGVMVGVHVGVLVGVTVGVLVGVGVTVGV